MKQLQKVLVLLDGYSSSEDVFPGLDALVGSDRPEIHLMRVIKPFSVPYVPFVNPLRYRKERVDEARRYLEGLGSKAGQRGFRVQTHVRVGSEPREVDRVADEQDVDLIACSSRYAKWYKKMLRGNVLNHLVRSGERNILVVGSG